MAKKSYLQQKIKSFFEFRSPIRSIEKFSAHAKKRTICLKTVIIPPRKSRKIDPKRHDFDKKVQLRIQQCPKCFFFNIMRMVKIVYIAVTKTINHEKIFTSIISSFRNDFECSIEQFFSGR